MSQTKMRSKVKVQDGENTEIKKYETETKIIERAEGAKGDSEDEIDILDLNQDSDKIVTVKDMCKIGRTDITSKSKKDVLFNTVVFAIGVVLNVKKYRLLLTNSNSKTVTLKMKEIFKNPEFRKELASVVARSLAYKANLANYVVVIGNDYE